ncbi:MAG: alpha-galactosidase [Oscillospiraceae bacterium]
MKVRDGMVTIKDDIIEMHTQDTSYILYTGRDGLVETLHYGSRIRLADPRALVPNVEAGFGGDVLRLGRQPALSSLLLELAPQNRGDYRRGALLAEMPNGARTSDFTFRTARLLDGPAPSGGMPQGRTPDKVLALSFSEASGLEVELFYSVFYAANVITKKMRVTNRAAGPIRLERCLSNQLDFARCDFDVFTLTGAWAREFQLTRRPLAPGALRFGNGTGASGNRCNPFFFMAEKDATESSGGVYGFNLVYSGSHEASVEVDSHGRTRVLQGVWSDGFSWPLAPGALRFGNGTGASGNRCNPFFFMAEKDATESSDGVYGFNLVYSGSHEASVEVDSHGRTRVLQGVWSDGFSWPLAPGESFVTPEAVLTFSDAGKTGMSHNMHRFVRGHIVPPRWRDAVRPVLVNNWEGTYFNFTEGKLLSIARTAAKLGVELLVLDDGWFGTRNNDKGGLGDYDVNRKKLPDGLSGLAKKVNRLGMDFGLWFEPEMVSADSKLFRAHPDWHVHTPGIAAATGRQQYVLDLCRPEVREYIISSVGGVLDSANIRYVKWDMNRHVSDNYSPALADQGSFMHRFTLGLYEVFEQICATRPDILFEGCSSGGNRFDLGVLYFMPQIWTSDDSDAHERHRIQTGASYGYPQCTMGCHVSAVPNHQTLRKTPLATRFNTAAFGLLGYELDMTTLTKNQKKDVKAQIDFYKKHREVLQFGTFYRVVDPFEAPGCRWVVVSEDRRQAIAGDFMGLLVPNSARPPMRLAGLDDDTLYHVAVLRQKVDIDTFGGLINFILPVHLNPDGALVRAANRLVRLDTEDEAYLAYGGLLCKAGLSLMQDFSGAGYSEEMRFMTDSGSRLYTLRAVDTQHT